MTMDATMSHEVVDGGVLVAYVGGELDVYTAFDLRKWVLKLLDEAGGEVRHLVFEVSGLDYIDSTGLGVLVGLLKRVRGLPGGEGRVVLAAAGEPIAKIFRLTGLEKVFPMHAAVEEAVGALVGGS